MADRDYEVFEIENFTLQRGITLPKAELAYQTRLIRAFEYVAANSGEVDFVLVTNIANQPYIYALLAELPRKCRLDVEFPKNEIRNMSHGLARTKRRVHPQRARKCLQRSRLASFP